MFSRNFTEKEIQDNKLSHKHIPPQISFYNQFSSNDTPTPVHYLIQHENVLPTESNNSFPILGDDGTDQFTLRINDHGNDIQISPLDQLSFRSLAPFKYSYKRPKNVACLHWLHNPHY